MNGELEGVGPVARRLDAVRLPEGLRLHVADRLTPAGDEVFRAEFDAAHKYDGLWIAVWHSFVSGRMSRAYAIAGLIDHMQAADGVWFAPLEEIAAHVRRVVADGTWTPRVDRPPYYDRSRAS